MRVKIRELRRRRRRSLPKPIELQLGRGLSKREAFTRGKRRLPRGRDFRGFSYDARTGRAVFI